MANALEDAVRHISDKTPIGALLKSKGWQNVPVEFRLRSLWSAQIESERFLMSAQAKLKQALALQREKVAKGEAFIDRSVFIAEMRDIAIAEGIFVDPLKAGGLEDITSRRRLGLIWDMQDQQAKEYARWKTGQDEDVLDAFPAQELIRLESRDVPRKWLEIWGEKGGKTYEGRMIARKDSGIWVAISRFGTPWPPFDWGSGMGLDDVSRDEAEDLGVIEPNAVVSPQVMDFNAGMRVKVDKFRPGFIDGLFTLFGDLIRREGNELVWAGGVA